MNFEVFRLSFPEIGICFLIGAGCGLVFMYLLWKTVKLLPVVKHKYLFLFVSKVLRIFLLLCVMMLLSEHHAGKFLSIFCGFLIVRLIVLKFVSFRICHETEENHLPRVRSKSLPRILP